VVLFLRCIFGLIKSECKCAYAETTVAVETEKTIVLSHVFLMKQGGIIYFCKSFNKLMKNETKH